jgi:hypothetical protein
MVAGIFAQELATCWLAVFSSDAQASLPSSFLLLAEWDSLQVQD